MSRPDPYEALGVPRDASPDEIKSAYRRLARRYHPDVNPNDAESEEKFKEVSQAYAVLSDADKKARFDQFGTTDEVPADPFFGGGGGIGDLFEMFFGGMAGQGQRARGGARNGDDAHAEVHLNLKDVLEESHHEVHFDRYSLCEACRGSGVEGGGQPDKCPKCKGSGFVSQVRNTMLGTIRTSAPCPECDGEGVKITNKCHKCGGSRLIIEHARVEVRIPAGVDHGVTMHVPGQGSEGLGGGRSGDLYVNIFVEADKRFARQGQTLFTTLELTYAQAALGDKVTVEGLDDAFDLEIPPGTQPGTRFAVKGVGLPPLHGGRRGEMVVAATVKVPTHLNDAQIALIKELAEVGGEVVPSGPSTGLLGGLFKKKK